MRNDIKFIALGGGQAVGASCYFLKTENHSILLDCGKGICEKSSYGPNLDALYKIDGMESISQIDSIFVSHGHYDHVGYIAEITESCRYTPVYATALTKLFAKHLIDEKTIEERAKLPIEMQIRQDSRILSALEHITPIGYNSKISANNMQFTFFKAGHIPGAAMIYIECDGRKILYTGDFSGVPTPLADKYIPPESISPDTVIICGVHAKHPKYKYSEDLSHRLKAVYENLRYNLPVHIGVKQLTKGIELIQFIRDMLPEGNIPIYLDADTYAFAEKTELASGRRILDKYCGCYDFSNQYKPKGIYIGAEKYNRLFRHNHSIDYSLHSTYADIEKLLSKYKPENAVIVHTSPDRENKYNNILAESFPEINIIYAENSELYEF